MKTIMTSNWRPLRCALCTLLIGIATLWAMPRSARAQLLYVVQNTANSVGEYNVITGAVINANFITGLSGPGGLAVASLAPATPGVFNLPTVPEVPSEAAHNFDTPKR
jgi:hypothetical protein